MSFLIASLTLAMVLTVWFQTNAFVEYMRLFRLTRFFKLDEFLKVEGGDEDYLSFLTEYYDGFLIRLVTCPVCLSFWLGLLISLVFGIFSYSLAVTFVGLLGYHILNRIRNA